MSRHYCTSPDYPGGRISCMCIRDQDHPEELFDVPVGEEPDATEDES